MSENNSNKRTCSDAIGQDTSTEENSVSNNVSSINESRSLETIATTESNSVSSDTDIDRIGATNISSGIGQPSISTANSNEPVTTNTVVVKRQRRNAIRPNSIEASQIRAVAVNFITETIVKDISSMDVNAVMPTTTSSTLPESTSTVGTTFATPSSSVVPVTLPNPNPVPISVQETVQETVAAATATVVINDVGDADTTTATVDTAAAGILPPLPPQ